MREMTILGFKVEKSQILFVKSECVLVSSCVFLSSFSFVYLVSFGRAKLKIVSEATLS